jgi:hypothetical protein
MAGGSRRFPLSSALVGGLLGIIVAGSLAFGWHMLHHPETDLHEMLHQAVPLDAEERSVLDARERTFIARRTEIESRMRAANARLADAIAADPRWSPEVEAATRQVEQAAGDLQRATLVHVFEMRADLKPEHRAAYDKVLVAALRRGSR